MTDSKPSKSARKREHLALQELGEKLITLSEADLDSLALDDALQKAVRQATAMKSHGALRRQKQLIGKLMRQVDPEPIRAAIARLSADDLRARRIFARAERWRDQLVRGDRNVLSAFEAEVDCEDEDLRRLLRDLDSAHDERTVKSLRRRVFRRIHAILVAQSSAS